MVFGVFFYLWSILVATVRLALMIVLAPFRLFGGAAAAGGLNPIGCALGLLVGFIVLGLIVRLTQWVGSVFSAVGTFTHGHITLLVVIATVLAAFVAMMYLGRPGGYFETSTARMKAREAARKARSELTESSKPPAEYQGQ